MRRASHVRDELARAQAHIDRLLADARALPWGGTTVGLAGYGYDGFDDIDPRYRRGPGGRYGGRGDTGRGGGGAGRGGRP